MSLGPEGNCVLTGTIKQRFLTQHAQGMGGQVPVRNLDMFIGYLFLRKVV